MKKVFTSLLYLLLFGSVRSKVYASGGIGPRDAFIGGLSRLFASNKDDGGTRDQYASRLRENIKVLTNAAGVAGNCHTYMSAEEEETLESILIYESRELHERTRKSLVKRTCGDIGDNLRDCPDGCSSCCCGFWDCLKGLYECCCSSRYRSGSGRGTGYYRQPLNESV